MDYSLQRHIGPGQQAREGIVQRLRVLSTLDWFVVRNESAEDGVEPETTSLPPQEETLLPSCRNSVCVTRNVRNCQLLGTSTAPQRALLQHHANSSYKEVASMGVDLPGNVSCLQLNSSGSLLALALDSGNIPILDTKELWRRSSIGNVDECSIAPKASLNLGNCAKGGGSMAWSPLKEHWLYCISLGGYCVDGVDINRATEGANVKYGPGQSTDIGSSPLRHLAIDFFKSEGPHLMATSCTNGVVALWDARAHKRTCSLLRGPQHTGSLLSVQVAPDGKVVIAGSECGQVLMWDVRGGRAATAQLGAHGPARHPLLAAVRLRAALAAVPGLTAQTPLPGTALQSLLLDPCDPRRVAFSLPSGWQGVLDLVRQGITHLHCPPHGSDEPSETGWMSYHHQPAWGDRGGPYCSPSSTGVTVLDFNSRTASPCSTSGSFGERMGLPSRAHVPTTSRPAALAVHPETKEIVVATSRDCRLLLLDRAGRSCQDEPG